MECAIEELVCLAYHLNRLHGMANDLPPVLPPDRQFHLRTGA